MLLPESSCFNGVLPMAAAFTQNTCVPEKKDPSPSVKRLLEAAYDSKLVSALDQDGVCEVMGITAPRLGMWKIRGVSADGALKAQETFGCSMAWILSGQEPKWLAEMGAPQLAQSIEPAEPTRPAHILSTRARGIAEAFDQATAGLSSYHRSLVDCAIIQVIESQTQPGVLPVVPQIGTPARRSTPKTRS